MSSALAVDDSDTNGWIEEFNFWANGWDCACLCRLYSMAIGAAAYVQLGYERILELLIGATYTQLHASSICALFTLGKSYI